MFKKRNRHSSILEAAGSFLNAFFHIISYRSMPRMCFHIYVSHFRNAKISDRPVWWKYPNVQAFPAHLFTSAPFCSICAAKECLSVCGVISCWIPASSAYPFRTFQNPCLLMDFPEQLVKDSPSHFLSQIFHGLPSDISPWLFCIHFLSGSPVPYPHRDRLHNQAAD